MADNEEREEGTSRGNGWEVVSLTSSAYAAVPVPDQVNANDDSGHTIQRDEAMFMSGHFVFPPSQHENLPLEPENVEVQNMQEISPSFSRLSLKEEDNQEDKGFGEADEFDEETTLQGLDLNEKDSIMTSALKFGYVYSEPTGGGSTAYDENTVIPEHLETSEGFSDKDMLRSSNNAEKDDEYENSALPCEAWWKRGAASLYAQTKEANPFWSIFVAAAVVGLVVLGRHLHREKLEVLHQKWLLNFNSEKLKRSFGPITCFKAFIEGGSLRGYP